MCKYHKELKQLLDIHRQTICECKQLIHRQERYLYSLLSIVSGDSDLFAKHSKLVSAVVRELSNDFLKGGDK